jgi:hypothetical protein
MQGASGEPQSPAPGDSVPSWDRDRPGTLLVPVANQVVQCVRLKLGGVLLPADCTEQWHVKYRADQQVLAVNGWNGSLPLLEGAEFLPSTLMESNGHPDTPSLVIHASWPLSLHGRPVSNTATGATVQEIRRSNENCLSTERL